jgi:hypothetical protein
MVCRIADQNNSFAIVEASLRAAGARRRDVAVAVDGPLWRSIACAVIGHAT